MLPASQIQEDLDYIILDEECFKYLYSIYGGTDIRRLSIQLDDGMQEEELTAEKQKESI
jgi:hypothetical protein|tara:strand:+ start:286 stop:462 length:177 start_codon:yes stop_codon:yes gene_type:complete